MRISLDLPDDAVTVPLCRRVLRVALGELGVEADRVAVIELVLSEATGNVVRHAYAHPGHRYQVEIEIDPERLRLVVRDSGGGFLRSDVPEPDNERPGGRGIWLIEHLASSVIFSTVKGGGSRLEAEFTLP